ncbi:MAG: hypothetical protein HY961_18825 [Ignavibacteriae bacterium]|nr:hypothetical protein [Ignavibacteriota bacterium]
MKTRTAVTYLIATYAILGGMAFFFMQSEKLLRPESAESEMASLPLGRYNWGYVWSDTLVAGPALLVGGIFLLLRNSAMHRLGQLLAFTGFAINLYAMIGLWVGYRALGSPMHGAELWMNIVLTFLGVLCMISLAVQLTRDKLER